MLGTADFLSAIRVNKQCYAARLKKSAWPTLQLDSFIQSLRDNEYDNPAHRRLRLGVPFQLSMHSKEKLLADAASVFGTATPSAWRFANDVNLYSCPLSSSCNRTANEGQQSDGDELPGDLLLSELARMPCLTAVNFHWINLSAAAFEQFCIVVAPRLQVLLFKSLPVTIEDSEVDPLTHISLLRVLRVLVVDKCPPAPSLLKLHRLVYLHVTKRFPSYAEGVAVRQLSSSHELRSLSFDVPTGWLPELLLATVLPAHLSADHATLVDWTQPVQLTDLSFASHIGGTALQDCVTIPSLTRLQVHVAAAPWESKPLPTNIFARLQELHVQLDDERSLPLSRLAECNQLRVLQLCFGPYVAVSARSLCAIVAANATTLEELRFSHKCGHECSFWQALKSAQPVQRSGACSHDARDCVCSNYHWSDTCC
jgi:hypothetical protein